MTAPELSLSMYFNIFSAGVDELSFNRYFSSLKRVFIYFIMEINYIICNFEVLN
jgi:hypothetical protein